MTIPSRETKVSTASGDHEQDWQAHKGGAQSNDHTMCSYLSLPGSILALNCTTDDASYTALVYETCSISSKPYMQNQWDIYFICLPRVLATYKPLLAY